ncbi:MAG: signal peptidase I [Clostridia bacterium]|nr:signal peptidase I [Clostridia bacterium]
MQTQKQEQLEEQLEQQSQQLQEKSEQQNEETKVEEKKPLWREILSWVTTLGMAVIIALAIRAFVFEPIRVDGESMMDTLLDGEIMIVTKPEYLFGDPQVGDVIICHYPGRGNTNFVKRVIGVPGDTLEIRDDVVYRNGEVVEEPYLTPARNVKGFDMAPFTVGEDQFFVAGDNRDNSHDSRNYYYIGGPAAIDRSMIVGHVRWVVLPFDHMRGVE